MSSRGNERGNSFLEDGDKRRFPGILEGYHERCGILISCYVLTDNHLVVGPPRAISSKGMQA